MQASLEKFGKYIRGQRGILWKISLDSVYSQILIDVKVASPLERLEFIRCVTLEYQKVSGAASNEADKVVIKQRWKDFKRSEKYYWLGAVFFAIQAPLNSEFSLLRKVPKKVIDKEVLETSGDIELNEDRFTLKFGWNSSYEAILGSSFYKNRSSLLDKDLVKDSLVLSKSTSDPSWVLMGVADGCGGHCDPKEDAGLERLGYFTIKYLALVFAAYSNPDLLLSEKILILNKLQPIVLSKIHSSVASAVNATFLVVKAFKISEDQARIIGISLGDCTLLAYDKKTYEYRTLSPAKVVSDSPNAGPDAMFPHVFTDENVRSIDVTVPIDTVIMASTDFITEHMPLHKSSDPTLHYLEPFKSEGLQEKPLEYLLKRYILNRNTDLLKMKTTAEQSIQDTQKTSEYSHNNLMHLPFFKVGDDVGAVSADLSPCLRVNK